MQLSFTQEQEAIQESARRFCRDHITVDRLRAWERTGAVDLACWQAAAALGWFSLGMPANAQAGIGLTEVACLLFECARGLAPRSLINAIRGAYALAGVWPSLAERDPVGRGIEAVALVVGDLSRHPRKLICVDGQTRLLGEHSYVSDADRSEWHLVEALDEEGNCGLVLVRRPSVLSQPRRTLDGDRQFHVEYDHSELHARIGSGADGHKLVARLKDEQTALALAEMLGAMDAALAMTVDYVKQREQFGQKLAVFQAVQHQVADMAMAWTASRHLAWQAITHLATGTLEGSELATACAYVGQAAKRLTLAAHHLHGGAGFVVDHPLHFHSERAQALCLRYAPEGPALAAIAAALLD